MFQTCCVVPAAESCMASVVREFNRLYPDRFVPWVGRALVVETHH